MMCNYYEIIDLSRSRNYATPLDVETNPEFHFVLAR